MISLFSFACTLLLMLPSHAAYNLAREYNGVDFFSDAKWDFYGYYDNLTAGNVNYLNQADATSQNLAYVTPQGTAIIKVDNSTDVPVGKNRNSIRIASNDIYPIGSLWIMDLLHIPYGCSVWPSVWTTGLPWPEYGEIDIIEGVNLGDQNQMVAHTLKGCTKTDPLNQTGTSTQTDCSVGAGCIVLEQQPNSYGSGFAQAGGGVFAAQLDASGINMWFWSRPNVPASITEAASSNTIDISTWGNPSAAYPTSSCDISQYFGAQRLTVDITLCGVWAGLPVVYQKSCTGACTVSGPGSPQYDDAYFEFNYIRGYTLPGISVFSTRALNYSTPDALSSTVTPGASSTTPVLQSSAVGATASSSSSHSSAEWSRSLRGWVLYFITVVPVMVGCWAVWN